jgi:hypothetical protein
MPQKKQKQVFDYESFLPLLNNDLTDSSDFLAERRHVRSCKPIYERGRIW